MSRTGWWDDSARFLLALGLLSVATACGGDVAGEDTTDGACPGYRRQGFAVEGTVQSPEGLPLPVSATVGVAWIVSTATTDRATAFGGGCYDSAAGAYVVALADDPPPEALNAWGTCRVGIGTVHLLDGGVTDASDVFSSPDDGTAWLGGTDRFAIIYLEGACGGVEWPGAGWPGTFPPGYSLGRCVLHPGGFDAYEPADPTTTDAVLDVADDPGMLEWCNWT